MNDQVLIAGIVVAGIVVLGVAALYLLRGRIGSASIQGNKKGVSLKMNADQPPRSSVSGNVIKGDRNTLASGSGAQVDKNQVEGSNNKLSGN